MCRLAPKNVNREPVARVPEARAGGPLGTLGPNDGAQPAADRPGRDHELRLGVFRSERERYMSALAVDFRALPNHRGGPVLVQLDLEV